jgi:hypothetical protein
MFNIGSPASIADPIMERASQAAHNPRIFHTHFATWEVNPKQSEALICEEFAGDPVKLQRDFYGIPPKAMSPFISEDTDLLSLTSKEEISVFEYDTKVVEDFEHGHYLRPVPKSIKPDAYTPRILTADNGEVKNSFSLVLSRYYPEHDGMLIEQILEVAPYPDHKVDLAWCYDQLIVPLTKALNIVFVGYDQWQSSQAIHDLRTNHRIQAEKISLKWKDFNNFRDDLYNSKIWIPEPEIDPEEIHHIQDLAMRSRHPKAHLIAQLETVNQFGKKVFKPEMGNDDIFRAAVIGHSYISANKKELRKKTKLGLVSGARHLGTVGIFSSRGNKNATAGGSYTRRPRGAGTRRSGATSRSSSSPFGV